MKPSSALSAAAQVLAALMVFTGDAVSQSYPAKPFRVVLPFAPGGTSDGLARIIGPRLGESLGQPLVIDNRPGAGGNIAAEIVAKSAPDGYSIYMGSAVLTTSQSLYSKLAFDPVRDFAPITQLATGPYFLVVHPSVPAKTVSELVAIAKAKPGGLNYASSGVGVPSHLAAELFKSRAGIEMVHVAYKGGGPEIRERIINIGYEPTGTTPEELPEFLRTESAILAKVIRDANIRVD